jgi:hypothetical protein
MVELEFAPDTWTPSQLAELRDGLEGNGAADLVAHRPDGTGEAAPHGCDECGKELIGGETRRCSITCKRRNEKAPAQNCSSPG